MWLVEAIFEVIVFEIMCRFPKTSLTIFALICVAIALLIWSA